MTTPFVFRTPAGQVDFPNEPVKQAELIALWNTNLNGFIQQGMAGNPWNATNVPVPSNYFNPLDTPIPSGAVVQPIQWQAFPGRISYYNPTLTAQQVLALADTGYESAGGPTFPPIIINPCTGGSAPATPYGPYGPRGWQDEYCEWAVTRDSNNNIIRIDFTCENPEYWNSLWMIDPQKVLSLYQSTLNKPQIVIEDLYLYDSDNKVVTDPSTGRPAYNPLNKWNSGPASGSSGGGAMHLTSTPNTIQTETGLACASTVQRTVGNSNLNTLICCAQYGQPHRNSDPNIGGTVNQLVSGGFNITLTNPPGLYIQMPDFTGYSTPDSTPASNFWTIVRGNETLNDTDGNQLPGNFILHAVFEVPAEKGYTVSDIKINGENIVYGGQVVQTFFMHLLGTAFTGTVPATFDCVGTPATSYAQPLQMFYADVFDAMNAQNVPNVVSFPMTLLSNSTLIAPIISQGTSGAKLVLTCDSVTCDPGNQSTWPTIAFDGSGDITATVTSVGSVTYAVPGNSYPNTYTVLYFSADVASNAKLGLRNVFVTNQGQQQGTAMPALLNVII